MWRSSRKATFVLVCVRLDSSCVQRTSKQGQPGCEMPLMDHMKSQAAFCTFAIVHSGNANHISVELFRIPFEIVQDGGCASHHIDRWIWQCSVCTCVSEQEENWFLNVGTSQPQLEVFFCSWMPYSISCVFVLLNSWTLRMSLLVLQ